MLTLWALEYCHIDTRSRYFFFKLKAVFESVDWQALLLCLLSSFLNAPVTILICISATRNYTHCTKPIRFGDSIYWRWSHLYNMICHRLVLISLVTASTIIYITFFYLITLHLIDCLVTFHIISVALVVVEIVEVQKFTMLV